MTFGFQQLRHGPPAASTDAIGRALVCQLGQGGDSSSASQADHRKGAAEAAPLNGVRPGP